jgi:hypothetical protein
MKKATPEAEPQQVFIVCQFNPANPRKFVIVGLFSAPEKAVEACETPQHGFAPLTVDEAPPAFNAFQFPKAE